MGKHPIHIPNTFKLHWYNPEKVIDQEKWKGLGFPLAHPSQDRRQFSRNLRLIRVEKPANYVNLMRQRLLGVLHSLFYSNSCVCVRVCVRL